MKKLVVKKLILILGIIALISNGSPLFAMILELQILGGGYKLQGPDQITFSPVSSSAYPDSQTTNLRDIVIEHRPDGTDIRSMLVIDENGGNPFDVTVSTTEMKKNEALEVTTLAGSNGTNLLVSSTTGFLSGDTIIINGYQDSSILTIDSVLNGTTLQLSQALASTINADITVSRVVDCNLTPKKCISLSNLLIKNDDGQGDPIKAINGDLGDLSLNAQTSTYFPFKGETVTISGSNGHTLKVNDSSIFLAHETISFPASSGVTPLTNEITNIDDNNTITLQNPFITSPETDITVQTDSARTLTLYNGTGKAPGEFETHLSLREIIPAGQLPGLYQCTLNFTIV